MTVNRQINKEMHSMLEKNYSLLRKDCFQTKTKTPLLRSNYLHPRLVYDGIVDEDKYIGIVYLLKEATEAGAISLKEEEQIFLKQVNGYPNDLLAWDFIATTKSRADEQKSEPKNWKILCCRTEAIMHPDKLYPETLYSGENLLKIALINIKKTTGATTSDETLLNSIADDEKYSELIREQFRILNEHKQKIKIVVCCGTFEQAQKIFAPTTYDHSANDSYFTANGYVFLKSDHPSRPFVKHEAMYNKFRELYSALSKKGILNCSDRKNCLQ